MKNKTKIFLGLGAAAVALYLWKSKKGTSALPVAETAPEVDKSATEKVTETAKTVVKDVVQTVKETVSPTKTTPPKKVVPNPITEPEKYIAEVDKVVLPPTVQEVINKIPDPVEREVAENATKHLAYQNDILINSTPPAEEGKTKIISVNGFGQSTVVEVPTEAIQKAIETKTYWGETVDTTPAVTTPIVPVINILKPIKMPITSPSYTFPVKSPSSTNTIKQKPVIDFIDEYDNRGNDRESWA